MSNIILAQPIPPGPQISGTVNVSLIELDQMRSDHAKLREMCAAYERNKFLVEVIYKKAHVVNEIDRYGSSYPRTEWEVVRTEYHNLDDVRKDLRVEEEEKVSNEVKQLTDQIKIYKTASQDREERIKEYLLEINSLKHQLESHKESLEIANEQLAIKNQAIENDGNIINALHEELATTQAALKNIKKQESFWSFLKY